MFILKNALISIFRNKGRNVLIGIIFLVIACACTITLAIVNTADDLIDSYESSYEKDLTISFNRENMMKDMDFSNRENMDEVVGKLEDIPSITIEDVESFKDSDHIKSYSYTYSLSLNGSDIDPATNEEENNFSMPGGRQMPMENSSDFTVTGYSSIEAMSEFIDGTYTMVEITEDAWEKAFDGNYVFINEELASYNELSLEDSITLETEDGEKQTFTIIGIFKDHEETGRSLFSNSVNTLITNADCLVNLANEYDLTGNVNATFIIDDYENKDVIAEEFYQKGLDENYSVQTNEELATSSLSGVQNVKSFATTFFIITLIIGSVVLIIVNMINIRERKYEIGVLRTIGLSKIKLTCQFMFELFVVAFLALMLGAGAGAILSKDVSNSLLASEISSANSENERIEHNFGGGFDFQNIPRGQAISQYDSLNAVVDFKVIVQLLGIGLVLVFIGSASSMISIQRFSPLTILKERS